MKKIFSLKHVFLILLISVFFSGSLNAYMVKYKEDYYRLYHVTYHQTTDDCIENIYWLEKAVRADFCNSLYAEAKIENEEQWEKYRYLFQMHLNLKLIEQHNRLARLYDKRCIYFYDSPWKEEYTSNLQKAKSCYEAGLYYWKEAKIWSEKASEGKFRFLFITELRNWEDENYRISEGELDYEKILTRELSRVNKELEELAALPDQPKLP